MITSERRDKLNFITVSSFGESLLKRITLVEEAFIIKVVLFLNVLIYL
jgi:hypothetical protein